MQLFVIGVVAALIPLLVLWGFTVDDALIPARYAYHFANGAGYVFNRGGAATDGVTPLGFVFLLEPFARGGPLHALAAARMMGALAWLLAAGLLGVMIGRAPGSRARFAAFLLIACSAPLGAWASAGLETGIVTALVTLGLFIRSTGPSSPRAFFGSGVFGLAAALRPELLSFALFLSFPRGPAGSPSEESASGLSPAHFGRMAIASLPFVSVAVVRQVVFGRPVPLSILAKPPNLSLGLNYALACFILTGPVALLAPLAVRRVEPWVRWLLAAVLVHFAAVVVVGGDWMPLSRLVVPALPAVIVAAAHLAGQSSLWFNLGRLLLALTGELGTLLHMRESAQRVYQERLALIEEAAPFLSDRTAVLAVDIGWLGAATDGAVVDLAGVTDPDIAVLPGSHTSKQIPDAIILDPTVDTIVLELRPGEELAPSWTESTFDKGVEKYVALTPGLADRFGVVHVTSGRVRYVILHRHLHPSSSEVPV